MGFRFTFVGPAEPAFRELSRDLADWDGVEFVEADLPPRLAGVVRRGERRLGCGSSDPPDLGTALAIGMTVSADFSASDVST